MSIIRFSELERTYFKVDFQTTEETYVQDIKEFFETKVSGFLRIIPSIVFTVSSLREQFSILGEIISNMTEEDLVTFKKLLLLSKNELFIMEEKYKKILHSITEGTKYSVKIDEENCYVSLYNEEENYFLGRREEEEVLGGENIIRPFYIEYKTELKGVTILERYNDILPYHIFETLLEYTEIFFLLITKDHYEDLDFDHCFFNLESKVNLPFLNKTYVEFLFSCFLYSILNESEFDVIVHSRYYITETNEDYFIYLINLAKKMELISKNYIQQLKYRKVFSSHISLLEELISKNDKYYKMYKRHLLMSTLKRGYK